MSLQSWNDGAVLSNDCMATCNKQGDRKQTVERVVEIGIVKDLPSTGSSVAG